MAYHSLYVHCYDCLEQIVQNFLNMSVFIFRESAKFCFALNIFHILRYLSFNICNVFTVYRNRLCGGWCFNK